MLWLFVFYKNERVLITNCKDINENRWKTHNVSRREVSHDEIELPVTHIY